MKENKIDVTKHKKAICIRGKSPILTHHAPYLEKGSNVRIIINEPIV